MVGILGNLFKTHACHRNVLRHFWFKPFSMGKPNKFGVITINRKIPNAFKGIIVWVSIDYCMDSDKFVEKECSVGS